MSLWFISASTGFGNSLILICGVLAQLGEHLPYKQRVIGSSPIGPTITDNLAKHWRGQLVTNLIFVPIWLNSVTSAIVLVGRAGSKAAARPIGSKLNTCADMAQLAEQLTCNQQVIGSSPIIGLIFWMGSRVAKGGRL